MKKKNACNGMRRLVLIVCCMMASGMLIGCDILDVLVDPQDFVHMAKSMKKKKEKDTLTISPVNNQDTIKVNKKMRKQKKSKNKKEI